MPSFSSLLRRVIPTAAHRARASEFVNRHLPAKSTNSQQSCEDPLEFGTCLTGWLPLASPEIRKVSRGHHMSSSQKPY
eukprot:jgi/Bigna1/61640/fgenesh1_kg.24_\